MSTRRSVVKKQVQQDSPLFRHCFACRQLIPAQHWQLHILQAHSSAKKSPPNALYFTIEQVHKAGLDLPPNGALQADLEAISADESQNAVFEDNPRLQLEEPQKNFIQASLLENEIDKSWLRRTLKQYQKDIALIVILTIIFAVVVKQYLWVPLSVQLSQRIAQKSFGDVWSFVMSIWGQVVAFVVLAQSQLVYCLRLLFSSTGVNYLSEMPQAFDIQESWVDSKIAEALISMRTLSNAIITCANSQMQTFTESQFCPSPFHASCEDALGVEEKIRGFQSVIRKANFEMKKFHLITFERVYLFQLQSCIPIICNYFSDQYMGIDAKSLFYALNDAITTHCLSKML